MKNKGTLWWTSLISAPTQLSTQRKCTLSLSSSAPEAVTSAHQLSLLSGCLTHHWLWWPRGCFRKTRFGSADSQQWWSEVTGQLWCLSLYFKHSKLPTSRLSYLNRLLVLARTHTMYMRVFRVCFCILRIWRGFLSYYEDEATETLFRARSANQETN